MKKLTLLFIILTTTLSLSSCQQVNDDVPLVLYNEVDPYILEFKQHILNNAEGRVDIVPYDSQNSQVLQNEIIGDILTSNPQILIVNPVDRLGAYTIIDQAKERDIPIVFINREPLATDMNRWEKTYYIGAPAENSAVLQSEMIIELFGESTDLSALDRNDDNVIQLVLLKGEQGHQDAEIRSEVVIEELENYGYELEILSIELCDWQKNIAFNHMNELLKNLDESQNIELVISNNDFMALGAIDSLRENGYFVDDNEDQEISRDDTSWIPIIGIDGIEEAFGYIENGYLYGTVINDSETMSEVLIDLVEALLQNTPLNETDLVIHDGKYIWIDYQKYEKEE